MTRFSSFTDDELDMMEEAFCNEGLKYLVFEIRKERSTRMFEPQESDHKCHTCKHYTSGERDGSCGSYICKEYSNWESEE